MHDPSRTRFSGSGTERNSACAASAARAEEVRRFYEANKITGPSAGEAAVNGDLIHRVLAAVPFELELNQAGMATGKKVYWRLLEEAQERVGVRLARDEFYFCLGAVRKRDDVIRVALAEAPNPDLSSIRINADESRIIHNVQLADGSTEPFSAVPDVHVSYLDGNKKRWSVALDFKSGYGADRYYQNAATNKQLASIVALDAWNEPNLNYALVALLKRHEVSGEDAEVPVAVFLPPQIEQAKQMVVEMLNNAAPLAREMASTGPSPSLDEKLRTKETVGNHCLYCAGKLACQKLRDSMRSYASRNTEQTQRELKELQARVVRVGEEITDRLNKDEKPEIMEQKDLAEALLIGREATSCSNLYEEFRKEADEVARQLSERGVEIPGVTFKPGNRKLKVAEYAKVKEDGEAPVPLDTTPKAVFQKLVTGGVLTDEDSEYEEFVGATAEINPAMCKQYLAARCGVTESKVYEKVLEPLGDKNPFELVRNRATVIVQPTVAQRSVNLDAVVATPAVATGVRRGR